MKKKRIAIIAGLVAAFIGVSLPMFFVFAGDGYKTTPKGLQYRIIKDNPGRTAQVGDYIRMHMTYRTDKDSVLFSTRDQNANQPLEIPVTAPQFNGDATEGFAMLSTGDSAEFKMPVDSIFKGQQMPPFAKPGGFIHMFVSVISVMTPEEREKAQAAEASKQNTVDEEKIQAYLKEQKLEAKKTESGLYYVLETQGDGPKVEKGKKVEVNYTGMLLNGEKFDSNVDPKFNHVQPFEFTVGIGQVIKGWDEGLQLLNKGGKAKLIIPSSLAYGSRGAGAAIPPNAPLVFDVEVTDVK